MAIPYLTVDRLTGQSVAQYDDGSIEPMGQMPGMLSPGGFAGGSSDSGGNWGGIPDPFTPIAHGGVRLSGADSAPSSDGGLADGFYDENGWGSGPLGSAGGLGGPDPQARGSRLADDRLRGAAGLAAGGRFGDGPAIPRGPSGGYGSAG